MGRNAGGVNGGTLGRSATERGYTEKMVKNIVGNENKIKGDRTESAYIYDADGNLLREATGGTKKEIHLGFAPANSIVSHNHPTERGEENALLTFSAKDLQYAVDHNVKEMRAVSKNHTFSMKRPHSGWGEKAQRESIQKLYDKIQDNIIRRNSKAVRKVFDKKGARVAKKLYLQLEDKVVHETITQVAKHFGWNYTMRKNK